MDRRVWRARAQGGYTRVIEIVNGREQTPKISVNKKAFGEQLAKELNQAYAQGVADAKPDVTYEVKARVADMLKEMGHDKAADLVRGAPLT